MKKLFCCPAYELFTCLPPLFSCLPFKKPVRLPGKKLQNATNWTFNPFCHCTMGVNLSFLIYCASFSSAKPCHLCHLATTLHQRFNQKTIIFIIISMINVKLFKVWKNSDKFFKMWIIYNAFRQCQSLDGIL